MKKRDVLLNISPFLLWIGFFVFEFICSASWKIMFLGQIAVLFALPLMISVYNTVKSADFGELFVKSILLTISNVIGVFFSTGLRLSFIYPDPKAEPVASLFAVIMLVYMTLITLICCGIKAITKHRKNLNK